MISLFPKPCSHFSLICLSPNFCSTSISCPSLLFYTLVLVGLPWWGNILPNNGSFHLWSLGGLLGLVYYSIMSYHVSKMSPTTLPLKWRSSNLCLTLNLMFGGQIPPKHYLPCLGCFIIHLASMDLSWTEINLNRPKLFREWADLLCPPTIILIFIDLLFFWKLNITLKN